MFYFVLVNLPLWISTFDTTNWSDDYQYTNLIAVQAKFSPILSLIFNPTGGQYGETGHFAPVYNVFNLLVTAISMHPAFFHNVVILCYVLTAFVIFLLVKMYYRDERLALLAGTLFALNYYLAFKALHWNTFHSHATNTLTGVLSVYFLLKFLKNKSGAGNLLFAALFLLAGILNYESGFVFYPANVFIVLYYFFKHKLPLRTCLISVVVLTAVMAVFPIGAYRETGEYFPTGKRLSSARTIQNYAFNANEVLVKSTGLTVFYNKLFFNKLKESPQLKDAVKKLLRQNDKKALAGLPLGLLLTLLLSGAIIGAALVTLLIVILMKAQPLTRLFIYVYLLLYFIFVVIFYRIDVANSIGVFSSIILADGLRGLLRDQRLKMQRMGIGFLGLIFAGTLWTVMDRFEDCYQKSFFGITSVAVKGPDRIYNEINRKMGHFIDPEQGMILFTHDHRMYHETTGFERIGDMVYIGDFVCYNATVFYKEFLMTKYVDEFRKKSLLQFSGWLQTNPRNRQIIVNSKDAAREYLRKNHIDLAKTEAIYISKEYNVTRLNDKGEK